MSWNSISRQGELASNSDPLASALGVPGLKAQLGISFLCVDVFISFECVPRSGVVGLCANSSLTVRGNAGQLYQGAPFYFPRRNTRDFVFHILHNIHHYLSLLRLS